ncbi:hypothetical protein E2320_020255, partial [Naja naja]
MAPKRQQKVELKARSNASPLNCRRGGWRQLLPSLPLETPQCLSADWDSAPPAPVVKGREAELHSAESLSGWALCLHPRSAASEPRKASPRPVWTGPSQSHPYAPTSDNRMKWSLSPSSSQGSRTLRGILTLEGCVRWVP